MITSCLAYWHCTASFRFCWDCQATFLLWKSWPKRMTWHCSFRPWPPRVLSTTWCGGKPQQTSSWPFPGTASARLSSHTCTVSRDCDLFLGPCHSSHLFFSRQGLHRPVCGQHVQELWADPSGNCRNVCHCLLLPQRLLQRLSDSVGRL